MLDEALEPISPNLGGYVSWQALDRAAFAEERDGGDFAQNEAIRLLIINDLLFFIGPQSQEVYENK